ncbi:MAG: nucleotidyltransferase domain-containing protein [Candidatus Omnitrophica bacterium]|nr:nucleotidyltransferase domain-containing protein [Candidatus Omnitrophota bacterium]
MLKTAATIDQITKEVVDFLSPHIQVERVILFGSYASGSFRKDSDFDMAVISRDFETMSILEKISLFSKTSIAVDSRVELKGFGSDEFLNPEKGSLMEMIKQYGKTMYQK